MEAKTAENNGPIRLKPLMTLALLVFLQFVSLIDTLCGISHCTGNRKRFIMEVVLTMARSFDYKKLPSTGFRSQLIDGRLTSLKIIFPLAWWNMTEPAVCSGSGGMTMWTVTFNKFSLLKEELLTFGKPTLETLSNIINLVFTPILNTWNYPCYLIGYQQFICKVLFFCLFALQSCLDSPTKKWTFL